MALDIARLQAFANVYETLNYTRSAESLYMTRQGLRKSMAVLEADVGHRLFRAVGNQLVATEAADRLYRASAQLLADFAVLDDEVARMRGSVHIRGGICYGHNATFTPSERKLVAARSNSAYFEGADVEFVTERDDVLVRRVAEGSLDFAWLLVHEAPEDFDTFLSKRGRLHLAVPAGNALAQQGQAHIDDLRDLPLAGPGDGFLVMRFLARQCDDAGFKLAVKQASPDLWANLSVVEAGLVGGAIAYGGAELYPRYRGVRFLPFSEPDLTWQRVLITTATGFKRETIYHLFCKHSPAEM